MEAWIYSSNLVCNHQGLPPTSLGQWGKTGTVLTVDAKAQAAMTRLLEELLSRTSESTQDRQTGLS